MKSSSRSPGQITVFLSLTLCMILALLLSLWESARTQGARVYFSQAVNSSMDSLFSQYHRDLWKNYRLLGLEHYADEQLIAEAKQFIAPYFDAVDWFPARLSDFTVEEKELLTDLDGELFEREVLDYMQYGILDSLWDYATADKMLADITEAAALDRVSDLYEGHTREAVRLEEAIEAIVAKLDAQKNSYEQAESAVAALDGDSFIRLMRAMQPPLEGIPSLVENYEEKADRLAAALARSRTQYETEKRNLSENVRSAMESDMREYESYVEKDGSRRTEITGFTARSRTNRSFLDSLIDDAEAVQDYIDSWEPEDEDDELDEAALWAPLEARFAQYDLIVFGQPAGVADKEKEGFLENVSDLVSESLLELVLPSHVSVSKETLSLPDKPSETCFSGINDNRLGLTDRVIMGEYVLKTLHYFGRELYGDSPETKGSGHAETEYVLNGKESDYDNLAETVSRILALREGLNLIYLFSDSGKRAEARTLAFAITGAAGFTPLITVMTFFILGVWALGQAICDVRDLLAGKCVPLMHTKESFYLSAASLLSIGETKGRLTESNAGENGLSYREYLRILLFQGQSSLYEYRSMDMIQMNGQSSQKDFLLNRCLYSLKLGAKAEETHLLALTGMLRSFLPMESAYTISTETFYRY